MNSVLISNIRNNIIKIIKSLLTLTCLIITTAGDIHATHIVGGQLNYRNLGKGYFELILIVRRDCSKPTNEPFDSFPKLGVFYNTINYPIVPFNSLGVKNGIAEMKLIRIDTIMADLNKICPSVITEVCVAQAEYRGLIQLREDTRSYLLAYQRCCRNASLENIENPLGTGSTFEAIITPLNYQKIHSNPAFIDSLTFPPIYICKDSTLIYNHSAIDYNGDSLVYAFCNPLEGHTKERPEGRPIPPFDLVTWKSPYSLTNLLDGSISINSMTGQLTVTPTREAQYLIGVCAYKYDRKAKEIIGYTRRDFQFNVYPCGTKPTANFKIKSTLCDGLNVQFENNSVNDKDGFRWYFDWINDPSQTDSINRNPTHRYSKAGTYLVLLVVRNGSCFHDTQRTVIVIDPQLKPDFGFTLNCIGGLKIKLQDSSMASGQIVKWNWTLTGTKDTLFSDQQHPEFTLLNEGTYIIDLVITDENGCTAMISKSVPARSIEVELEADSLTICRGDSVRLVKNPDRSLMYNWDPKTSLDLIDPSNPIAFPSVSTTYSVTISDGPCTAIKKIHVAVRDKIQIKLQGDTSVCNGMVQLIASSDTSTMFSWSLHPDFKPIIFMGDTFKTSVNNTQTFYVRGGKDNQCPDSTFIKVTNRSLNLKYNKEETICSDDTIVLQLMNLNTNDTLEILWEENPIIIGPRNVLNPTIYCPNPGRYILRFKIKNQFNCELSDSIIINAVLPPVPDFIIEYECGSLSVKVKTNNSGKIKWTFGDGKGTSNEKSTEYTYERTGKYIICLEVDSVCIRSICKEVTIVELISKLRDTVLSCFGESVYLNPNGNPDYIYEWTPETGLDNPRSHNPLATVSVTTTYYVKIWHPDFPNECFLLDSITVFVPPALSITAGPDTVLCEKTKITLCATANLSETEFEWCDANNKPIGKTNKIDVNPDSSTYYIVKAVDKYGCSVHDTVHVELYELLAKIEGDDIICIGDTTKIKIRNLSKQKYNYEWSPKEFIMGSHTDSIIMVIITKTTTFDVIIKNEKGCTWMLSKTIQVNNPQSLLSVSADPTTIVPGQKTQLTATYNPNWRYLWSPQNGTLSDSSIHNPVAFPKTTTTYTVTVTDENGCTATASVTITVQTCLESVFIPNAFSPNNDRINDVLYVRSRPNTITKMELVIYNRWGQKVFTSTNLNTGWDGQFDGELLKPDVFGYGLIFSCHENEELVKKGNISIIK
jgi:gliding motility-associated-like protein